MTPDLEGAKAFYGGLFGWTFRTGAKEAGFYTMCQLNGRDVAGMGVKPKEVPGPARWSVYFEADNVDAFVARATQLGGKVVVPPMDVFQSGRLAFIEDPTGAHFGLWQSREHHGAQLVGEPGTLVWSEVQTRDGARAKDFYTALLGLAPESIANMDYYVLNHGAKGVAGVFQMGMGMPADIPPHWMNYFAVEDTDAAAAKVSQLGGRVHVPPTDMPYGRFSVVTDPTGAAFTLLKPAPM
ncbi:VOC family protein [Myxococcus landrumensis]|uniref:VOC family protein n=2 Tax=Myxococcus landrumensis TaxID=2813577 RepID=A0ABX7NJ91_9BACT|nr:VOC family protein [Myxococcus landrumus]